MNGKKHTVAWFGGIVATVVLVAMGIAYVVIGFNGRSEVRDTIAREFIVGSPDMTPAAIRDEAQKARLDLSTLDIPTVSVAGKKIQTGSDAKAFAGYMRIHTFEATGGQTFAQMGRFLDKNGNPTSDPTKAAIDPKTKQPITNAKRDIWTQEVALTTGLNMSFFAEQVSLFGIAMGFALIVVGIGLGILTIALWGIAPWRSKEPKAAATPAPTA